MFTDDEAAAVALGLVAAQRLALTTGDDDAGDSGGGARTGGGGPGPAVDSAMAKLRRVLPASLAGRVAALTGALELTLARPGRAATASTGTLLALGEAVSGRHRVAIGYRSFSDKLSEREVDPYGLVFHAGRWYVTGLDHQSGELRTFRADRVSRVAARPEPFTPPAGFDPVGHVTRALAGVPYAWEVEVLLETDVATARRQVPARLGTLTEAPGGVLFTGRAENLDGMARVLAGWGWAFTVLRPDELRAEVIEYAARLSRYAERPGTRDD
jgi:predicted DNA-binding transcriptional regulator YafY